RLHSKTRLGDMGGDRLSVIEATVLPEAKELLAVPWVRLHQDQQVLFSAGALLTLSVAQASPTQWQIEPDCLQSIPFSPRYCRFRFGQLDRWSIEQRYLSQQGQADPRDARIITRPATLHLWRCRQSARHGVRDDFARCAGRPNALARNWRQHDRHRHAGAQIPS